MEAVADTHAHSHDQTLDLAPASWRDPKRYAWLLGLIVPLAPFLAWGAVRASGLGHFLVSFGPVLVFGLFPLLDIAVGMDATNPPDSVLKWLEQDRYYRWCPISLSDSIRRSDLRLLAMANGGLSIFDSIGLAVTMGWSRDRDQHRA